MSADTCSNFTMQHTLQALNYLAKNKPNHAWLFQKHRTLNSMSFLEHHLLRYRRFVVRRISPPFSVLTRYLLTVWPFNITGTAAGDSTLIITLLSSIFADGGITALLWTTSSGKMVVDVPVDRATCAPRRFTRLFKTPFAHILTASYTSQLFVTAFCPHPLSPVTGWVTESPESAPVKSSVSYRHRSRSYHSAGSRSGSSPP
jgi:hypothetical protein